MTDGALSELHGRLAMLQAELVEQLARDGIEGGTLALLAGINAAIAATEATAEAPAESRPDA